MVVQKCNSLPNQKTKGAEPIPHHLAWEAWQSVIPIASKIIQKLWITDAKSKVRAANWSARAAPRQLRAAISRARMVLFSRSQFQFCSEAASSSQFESPRGSISRAAISRANFNPGTTIDSQELLFFPDFPQKFFWILESCFWMLASASWTLHSEL